MLRFLLLFFLLFGVSSYGQETKYQLGQSVQLGDMPLYLGDYFSAEYKKEHGNNRYLTRLEIFIVF
ncbi:hypothetical protein [Sulfurovum sp. NBC37-1]|uniref:hypothetical protein n=1 Tax=Sulfurovum sp. (strain NBC37-1) TaxID=387093 RepID=UPI0002EFE9C7|nr:hypothetical protein [Sulfurovum sp. NBC37-1]